MEHTANSITLRGSLRELPQFSHENHGRRFYRFLLVVRANSVTVDALPVIAPEALAHSLAHPAGGPISGPAPYLRMSRRRRAC